MALVTRYMGAAIGLLALALPIAGRVHAGQPNIVNGVPTQQRPNTGALLFRLGTNTLFGTCSGTLVGCQHFVTAAHCVCNGGDFASCGTPNPADFAVFLQHVGVLDPSAIAVNPAYDGTANDMAVLTLGTPIEGVHPARTNGTGNPTAGMAGAIAGYGVTDGALNDFGILREGSVTISSCGGFFPEPALVCWTFEGVGPPGTDSDTCFGDSGGPLFVDFGGGEVLAGVTVSGTDANCRPTDVSDDTNVFQNQAFLQSIAGADLSNTSCGTITQVGDAGTVVTAQRFDGLSDQARICRRAVRKQYTAYTSAKLKLMRACVDAVDKGRLASPCPDPDTAARIARAAAKVDPASLERDCPAATVPTILSAGPCASSADANDLAACVVAAGDARVANLLDVEYADAAPSAPIVDTDVRTCQAAVSRAAAAYGVGRLKTLTSCQASEDRGAVTGCPGDSTSARLARAAAKVEPTIAKKCTDAQVQALDTAGTFGDGCAGASSIAALATCEIAAHDGETDVLLGLLGDGSAQRLAPFVVPAGAVRVRATLNGIDAGANDLDLYLKQGAPPTTTDYDARSDNNGVYESIDLPAPTSGTWYALVQPFNGANVPFQLTITSFQ